MKYALMVRNDDLSKKTKRSRNELINVLLDFAVRNCIVK
mgnify:CR=1 FL=1